MPLQVQMSTLLPLAVPDPESSRHFPLAALMGPLAGVMVQLNDTPRDVPDASAAVTVTA